MEEKRIFFNKIEFFISHNIYNLSCLEKDEKLIIWYRGIRKKITFEIDTKYDIHTNKIITGCWECVSHRKDQDGYPGFKLKKQMLRMHRFMYCLFNYIRNIKEIEGKIIRHKCDNRACSNPTHLEIGTHLQNMSDMKERNRTACGERNSSSKLTEMDILYIRGSKMDLSYLSEMYCVSKNTIRRIKKRQLWKHVKDVCSVDIDF